MTCQFEEVLDVYVIKATLEAVSPPCVQIRMQGRRGTFFDLPHCPLPETHRVSHYQVILDERLEKRSQHIELCQRRRKNRPRAGGIVGRGDFLREFQSAFRARLCARR